MSDDVEEHEAEARTHLEIERIRAETARDLARLNLRQGILPLLSLPIAAGVGAWILNSNGENETQFYWAISAVSLTLLVPAVVFRLYWDRQQKGRTVDGPPHGPPGDSEETPAPEDDSTSGAPGGAGGGHGGVRISTSPGRDGGEGDQVVNVVVNPQEERGIVKGWDPAAKALVVVAVVGGLFGLLNPIVGLITKEESDPDCLNYSEELRNLDEVYSDEQLMALTKELRFGDYEELCGRASSIVAGLVENTRPSTAQVTTSTTTTAPAAATP